MSVDTLCAIEIKYSLDVTDCLTQMLLEWRKQFIHSWNDLVKALRTEFVGEMRRADEIEKQYCPESGGQITGLATGEVCRN